MARKRKLAGPSYHGQRISETDLIEESHRALQAAGVGNYLRGAFVHELSTVVVGNPSPLLQHRQPKPVLPKTVAWKSAYEIVLQFLDDHNLALTRATYDVESPNTPRRHTVLTSARKMPRLIPASRSLRMRLPPPAPPVAPDPPPPKAKPEQAPRRPSRTEPPAGPARVGRAGGEIGRAEKRPSRLTAPKSEFEFDDDAMAMPDDRAFSSDDLGRPE
jgi:hypothetical protein